MTFISNQADIPQARKEPRIDMAWVLLGLVFATLLSAAVWSDHVVDKSLEDWHGNVRHYGPDYR